MSDPDTAPDNEPTAADREDVIAEERRQKHDEDEQADHLLHDEDLPDPRVEP